MYTEQHEAFKFFHIFFLLMVRMSTPGLATESFYKYAEISQLII